MSGVLVLCRLCSWLLAALSLAARLTVGPVSVPVSGWGPGPGWSSGPLLLVAIPVGVASAVSGRVSAAAAAAAAAPGPVSLSLSGRGRAAAGRLFGPRMDYDEWTPLGRGDPLKNDPTYDYAPPVLDRVHYWMEPKESNARGDPVDPFIKFVDNPNKLSQSGPQSGYIPLPVPATMLIPPPPPPPPPAPVATTQSILVPGAQSPQQSTLAPSSSYSSLNPFHHFEDQPVVTNIHFEENPLPLPQPTNVHFEKPESNVFEDKPLDSSVFFGEKPLLGDSQFEVQPATNIVIFEDKPFKDVGQGLHLEKKPTSSNVVLFEESPTSNKIHFADRPSPPAPKSPPVTEGKPAEPQQRPEQPVSEKKPEKSVASNEVRPQTVDQSGMSNAIPIGAALQDVVPFTPTVRPATPMSVMVPPPPPPTASTMTSPPPPPPKPMMAAHKDDSIGSLIKNLLHQDTPTTMSTLTTDPLFSHYKQPAGPVNGPPYLIIQGHSKVKTYGAKQPTSIHGILVEAQSHNDILKDMRESGVPKERPHRPAHRPGHRARRRAPEETWS